MKLKMFIFAFAAGVCAFGSSSSAAGSQILRGQVPAAIARLHLQPIGRLPATNRLRLAIGLPLRNKESLTDLLEQLYDPTSPNYHHYLTPQQFTERFGPTEEDYQSVIAFANTNGLTITGTYCNRVVLDVSGKVSDIEKAFHVNLRLYQHPIEERIFFAPDVEPSVDAGLPILDISGLDNYTLPHSMVHLEPSAESGIPDIGSATNGYYMGNDFRNAYVPGVTLDGSGQIVGLVDITNGYYPEDIEAYEQTAGLTNVTLQNVLLDGASGIPSPDDNVTESELDIEMAISMAPHLSAVVVFEGDKLNDILNAMAASNQIKQFSDSWTFDEPSNSTGDQILQQMAAQGQSFFKPSGDGDAWTSPIHWPTDSPWVTSVGGTELSMQGLGTSYTSETVWNVGYSPPGWSENGAGYVGSGGGISSNFSIPWWQTNTDMSANGGSATMRNFPDVAAVAYNIWVTYGTNQERVTSGTSCAAPLWAGFMALVNQKAASVGVPPVGFANPVIYAIGNGTNYTECFHDITTGNNTNSTSPTNFFATTGYDLCTGWGTPNGSNLITALISEPYKSMPPAVTTAPQGQSVSLGGSVSFNLTATGESPLTLQWYHDVTPLANDGRTQIASAHVLETVNTSSLTISNIQTSDIGNYYVEAANALGSVTSSVAVLTVYVPAPPFTITFDNLPTPNPTGDGSFDGSVPNSYSGLTWSNFSIINGVLETNSGYAAGVISSNNVAYHGGTNFASISSAVPFDLLSAYLTAAWNDSLQVQVLGYTASTETYSNSYTLSATGPTFINFDYLGVNEVDFTSSGGTHHSGYAGNGTQFVMDNMTIVTNLAVSVLPTIQTTTEAGNTIIFGWNAMPGQMYQVQCETNLTQSDWNNLGGAITATNSTIFEVDSISNSQRFYRIVLMP